MVKLTDKKIRWIVRNVSKKKVSAKEAARIYSITPRRVRQLTRQYAESGTEPALDPRRRPRTRLTDVQKQAIDEAWEETRLGARLLYYELRRRGHKVPKNKMHEYMGKTGRSRPNKRKQKPRKRCRYERKHTCSLLHADWTEHEGRQVIAFEDDASRKILSMGEFGEATAENAIDVLKAAEKEAAGVNCPIRELNTDRGSQFYANKWSRKGVKGVSEFEKYLDSRGIRHIPSRRNNPQTNGKIERWFQEYKKHRERFGSAEEFVEWYNNRLHGSLWLEMGETPDGAFIRKLRPECLIWLFERMAGGF
jgi:putative transposase